MGILDDIRQGIDRITGETARRQQERLEQQKQADARQAERERLAAIEKQNARDRETAREKLPQDRLKQPGPAERFYTTEAEKKLVRDAIGRPPAEPEKPKEPVRIATENELKPAEIGLQVPPTVGPGNLIGRTAQRRETFVDRERRREAARLAEMTPEQRAEHDRQQQEQEERRQRELAATLDHSQGRQPEDD